MVCVCVLLFVCACVRVCVRTPAHTCAGRAKFIHMGEEVDGVDMRAEVGLLSRNILLRGEMEPSCYGNEACKFFDFDTFGGHLKVRGHNLVIYKANNQVIHLKTVSTRDKCCLMMRTEQLDSCDAVIVAKSLHRQKDR